MKGRKNPIRLDTTESAYFTRQLQYVKSKTYDTKYQQLKALQIFPISTEAPSGASEITYRKYTGIGLAKIVSDYANDFPRVDIYGEEVTVKVFSTGDSYGYNIQEIRASQMAGVGLDTKRAQMAKRAQDELVNDIAFNGDTPHNITGFLALTGSTEYTLPADGTGATKTWSTKTPDQIIRDMSGLATTIMTTTNGVEIPDTILLPLEQYNLINDTRMEGDSNRTILKFFLENNQHIKNVTWLNELNEAGAGSTDRMIALRRAEDALTLEIPQPFEQFPAQQNGLEFEIYTHTRTAGVIVYYPLSIAYSDGL